MGLLFARNGQPIEGATVWRKCSRFGPLARRNYEIRRSCRRTPARELLDARLVCFCRPPVGGSACGRSRTRSGPLLRGPLMGRLQLDEDAFLAGWHENPTRSLLLADPSGPCSTGASSTRRRRQQAGERAHRPGHFPVLESLHAAAARTGPCLVKTRDSRGLRAARAAPEQLTLPSAATPDIGNGPGHRPAGPRCG